MSTETYNERIWRTSKFSDYKPKCKGCGAEILWMKTEKGKSIPVDRLKFIATGSDNRTLLDKEGVIHRNAPRGVTGWRPHWESCPQAGSFRKGETSAAQ